MSNTRSTELIRTRAAYSNRAFADLVVWKVARPVPGSNHGFKYRLAYVVDETSVLRYDYETGKGDHRHYGDKEEIYVFETPDKLMADFRSDIERWNRENSNS